MANAMLRILLPTAALAACSPAPQETVVTGMVREATVQGAREIAVRQPMRARSTPEEGGVDPQQAATGPVPEPVSAAGNPAPALLSDSPAQAQGRRSLSTAFVMVGPDGHLTIDLRDGRMLVLRDVVMRAKDYCGMRAGGGTPGSRYCGGYAEVAAARPGGAPVADQPDLAVSNPLPPARGTERRE